jgi:hypothetical protein
MKITDISLQALLAIAFLASTINLILLLYSGTSVPVLQTHVLEPVALAVSLILTILNHSRTRTSSSILLLFWPFYTVAFLVWVHTTISKDLWHLRPAFTLKTIVVLLGLSSFGLEFLAPKDEDEGRSEGKVNQENPIITANLFDRWTFGWMTPLMRKGAAQYITEQDLPPPLSKDDSANLGYDFQLALAKQYAVFLFLEELSNSRNAANPCGWCCSSRMGRPFWALPVSKSSKTGLHFCSRSFCDGYCHTYRPIKVLAQTPNSHQP